MPGAAVEVNTAPRFGTSRRAEVSNETDSPGPVYDVSVPLNEQGVAFSRADRFKDLKDPRAAVSLTLSLSLALALSSTSSMLIIDIDLNLYYFFEFLKLFEFFFLVGVALAVTV